MKSPSTFPRWITVVLFAVAMAWCESAVVFYLRTHLNRIEPFQANPLAGLTGFEPVEMAREVATLVMLFTVGALAGRTGQARIGYMLVAFGVWDILYYAFLRVICGWPRSLLDWDVLFLLPFPWWGPVLAPMLIALLMVVGGTLATQVAWPALSPRANWALAVCGGLGVALALYVFMADALRVAGGGETALRQMLPTRFNWPLFGLALGLMAVPVLPLGRRLLNDHCCGRAKSCVV